MLRTRVVATGLVQGVFFRDACRREAARAGVTGWVRNRPDGAVEAVFEGPPDAVRHMLDWCHRGPRHARVDAVTASEEKPAGLRSFDIVS